METIDTIYSAFRRRMIEHPDKTALFDEQRALSYRELDAMSEAIAASFPRKPRFVGIVMDHSVEMIAAILASLRAGAAYVPVEPSFPEERIRFIMEECGADFIICNSTHPTLPENICKLYLDEGYEYESACIAIESDLQPDSPAYVLYTSGSTGKPKGVTVSNANVCNYAEAFNAEFQLTDEDVMLQYSVCTFDIFVEEVFSTLLNGATLAIPSADTKNDMSRLMEFISRNRVTMLSGFPYLLMEMNRLPGIPSSLRLLISGGDVLRADYITNLLDKAEIYNTYGPSETTVCASYFRCNGTAPLADGTYPIGKPVKGVAIEILDDNLQPVESGEVGEICISGKGVSLGYIGGRENEAFVTLADGSRLYRSGDLGILREDGNILFLHRKDTQIMIDGRRVEPSEVQNVLCGCEEVETGIVCPDKDEKGRPALTAFVVGRHSVKPNLRSIRRRMSRFLPDYMIPKFFVFLKSLPLTPNGKVNVEELRKLPKNLCVA